MLVTRGQNAEIFSGPPCILRGKLNMVKCTQLYLIPRFTVKKVLLLSLLLSACAAPTVSTPDGVSPSSSPSPTVSSQPSAPPASSQPTTPANSALAYAGKTQDRTNPTVNAGTDGKNDHTFVYTHTFASAVSIQEIVISRIENGQPLQVTGWSTGTQRPYWLLSVWANGANLTESGKKTPVAELSGTVKFEMFGADPVGDDLSKPGTVYELLIVYSEDGAPKQLTQRVTL
jgi:hypothetical protein